MHAIPTGFSAALKALLHDILEDEYEKLEDN